MIQLSLNITNITKLDFFKSKRREEILHVMCIKRRSEYENEEKRNEVRFIELKKV
jgi:hypothetical protein